VSDRGSKHLRELTAMVEQGHRAVLLFCVQHTGIQLVRAAAHIDPVYAATLHAACSAGVQVIAYAARIQPEQNIIKLDRCLPVLN
jgi:sugar fermentation stimulation protein A